MASKSRRTRRINIDQEFNNIVDMRSRKGVKEYKVTCKIGGRYHEKWTSLPIRSAMVQIRVKVFHSGIKFANHPDPDELAKEYEAVEHPQNVSLITGVNQHFNGRGTGGKREVLWTGNILARRKTTTGNNMYFVVWLGCDNHFEFAWERESKLTQSEVLISIFESGVKFAEKQKNRQEVNASRSSGATRRDKKIGVAQGKGRVRSRASPAPTGVAMVTNEREGQGKQEEAPPKNRARLDREEPAGCSNGGSAPSGTGENEKEFVPVTITRATPPHRDLTAGQETEFGKLLRGHAFSQVLNGGGDVIPSMAGMTRVSDRLTVKCCNHETANWLIEVAPALGGGFYKAWLEPPPDVVSNHLFFVPTTEDAHGNPLTTDFVKNVIKMQNPSLHLGIDQWKFKKVYPGFKSDVSGTWIEVGIPEKIVPTLEKIEASEKGISFGIDKLERYQMDSQEKMETRHGLMNNDKIKNELH